MYDNIKSCNNYRIEKLEAESKAAVEKFDEVFYPDIKNREIAKIKRWTRQICLPVTELLCKKYLEVCFILLPLDSLDAIKI